MPVRDRSRKVEALVISHRDFGEADRIIKLFTKEEGKVSAIAKGVKRMHSRKAAHLEPFTHAALVLAVGRNFWIVTQADTLSDFPSIRSSLQKTAQASYVLELVDLLSSEFQVDRGMYRHTLEALKRIENGQNVFNAILFFELRVLDLAGFRPELFECVVCGEQIKAENQFFSAALGGVICPACATIGVEKTIAADIESLRYFRHFQRSAFRTVCEVEIPREVKNGLRRLLDGYISNVTEKKLNSTSFLDQVGNFKVGAGEQSNIE